MASKQIDVPDGCAAILVQHDAANEVFSVAIFNNCGTLPQEDQLFYSLLIRGAAEQLVKNMSEVIGIGIEAMKAEAEASGTDLEPDDSEQLSLLDVVTEDEVDDVIQEPTDEGKDIQSGTTKH